MYKAYTNNDGNENVFIDIDGSGPLKPFEVICTGNTNGKIYVVFCC